MTSIVNFQSDPRSAPITVKTAMASDPATAPATLTVLANDHDIPVVVAAVSNPSTPAAAVINAVQHQSIDGSTTVVAAALGGPHLTVELLDAAEGAGLGYEATIDALITNPTLTAEVWDHANTLLSGHSSTALRDGLDAVSRPADLTLLAASPVVSLRRTAAAHRSTPPEVLAELAHDPDPSVCAAVSRNTSASEAARVAGWANS